MNHHEFVDRAIVAASALLVRDRRFFAESVAGPRLVAAVADSRATPFEVARHAIERVSVSTPAGDLPAAYLVWQWRGAEYPTVVYHHGNDEDPFDFGRFARQTFGDVFVVPDEPFPANLVAVRAPFHGDSLWAYARRMTRLDNFVSMLAGSVALIEALVARLGTASRGVVVSGFSLGGWATNLHRTVHDTADAYVPMFAGAALDELFLTSAYRKLLGEAGRANPGRLRTVLNFEDAYATGGDAPVSALLGRYDQFVECERQRRCYDDADLALIDAGHVTGALAATRLREHVRGAVERVAHQRSD
jgi:dienelactone hydrolase